MSRGTQRATTPLPSAAHRRDLAARAHRLVAELREDVGQATLACLGDLGIALALEPPESWEGTVDALASRVATEWTAIEASAAVEIGRDQGLLEPDDDEDTLRVVEPELLIWLAARRTAGTEDADGILDHRLRGALAPLVALAVAEAPLREQRLGLVELLLEREGPWEDLLELGALLAATAVAWGAEADPETRGVLVQRAYGWTMPAGPESHHGGAVALLAEEVRSGPSAVETREALEERLDDLLGHLANPDLAGHPRLLASLDATLAPLAAAAGTDIEALRALAQRLGSEGSRVPRAVARVHAAGDARDALVLGATRAALGLGLTDALAALGEIDRPSGATLGLVQEALRAARETPDDANAVMLAMGACQAIASWPSLSELAAHLLSRLIVAPIHPDLRLGAAAALAAHPSLLAPVRAPLLETLEAGFDQADPGIRAGHVGAALELGSQHPEAGPMVVALVADGVPAPFVVPPLGRALRAHPHLAAGVVGISERFDEPPIHAALLEVIDGLAREIHSGLHLAPAARLPLLRYALPIAGDLGRGLDAGRAAVIAGWLDRDNPSQAETLLALRLSAPSAAEPTLLGLLDLALGAAGHPTTESVRLLATDVAKAPPLQAAAASSALQVLLRAVPDADPLEPHLPAIRARADLEGPQQVPIRDLLHTLATLPLRLPEG